MLQNWLIGMAKNYLIKNWRTTAAALVGYACTQIPQVRNFLVGHGYDLQTIQGAALLVIGVLAKDGSTTGVATPEEKKVDAALGQSGSPGGFTLPKVLLALLVLTVGIVAFAARADDPAPTRAFGGCNASGSLCAGPSAVAGLASYSLKTREFTTGLMAGACYGVQGYANKWYTIGVDGCANIRTGGGNPTSGIFFLPVSFAEYVRFGPAVTVAGSEKEWALIGALGLNFK
jgi:hypothetical protein